MFCGKVAAGALALVPAVIGTIGAAATGTADFGVGRGGAAVLRPADRAGNVGAVVIVGEWRRVQQLS